MSKKQKRQKHHKHPPESRMRGQRAVVSGINIPIPEELGLPPFVDASGLRASVVRINHIQGELARQREEARHHPTVEAIPPQFRSTLALIATNAWRAKVKMLEPDGQPKDGLSRIYRHIEGIFNAFDELGVKVIDPTGRAYDTGMALKAISFEQTPGLSQEEVKETIKPSVIWKDQLIQMGEVIVGTPEQKTTEKENENEPSNH